MDSRGFARAGASARDRAAGWWALVSLLLLGGSFVALIGESGTVAALLGLAGAIGLGAAILLASSDTRRTRYRPRRMRAADWIVAGISLLAPIAMASISWAGDSSLVWFASPLAWPTLHVLPALALLPLLVPALYPPGELA
jgi:hypothetical protein